MEKSGNVITSLDAIMSLRRYPASCASSGRGPLSVKPLHEWLGLETALSGAAINAYLSINSQKN